MRLQRVIVVLAVAAYAVAALAYGMHSYDTNPQYDNQGMRYAQEGIIAATAGTFGEYLLEERKYPLFYALPFALTYEAMLLASGGHLTDAGLYLASRLISLLFALGTFLALWRIGKRLGLGTDPVLLLMTSMLFLLFTSAIRPHVPVAFWTALTLLFALRAKEHGRRVDTALSFAMATAAFCTLQSGLLAFVFPLWALIDRPLTPKRIAVACGMLALSLVASIAFGYPFLLRPIVGLANVAGADLGHDVGLNFGITRPFLILWQLIGGELVLLIATIIGARALWRDRSNLHAIWKPIALYIALFLLIFGFHLSSAGRFFLPIFPVLALIGAVALRNAPTWVRPALAAFVIVASLRLTWLACTPNTYHDMAAFLDTRPPYALIVVQPDQFFPIDPGTLALEPDRLPLVRTVVIPDYAADRLPDMAETWPACHESRASRTTDEIVLLWNDTPFALWHLFEARALGPNMTAYCAPGR